MRECRLLEMCASCGRAVLLPWHARPQQAFELTDALDCRRQLFGMRGCHRSHGLAATSHSPMHILLCTTTAAVQPLLLRAKSVMRPFSCSGLRGLLQWSRRAPFCAPLPPPPSLPLAQCWHRCLSIFQAPEPHLDTLHHADTFHSHYPPAAAGHSHDPSHAQAVSNLLYNVPPADSSDKPRRRTLCALVTNESGVLSRVSGVLAGRGVNIDSLVVSETETAGLSRMTIVLKGGQDVDQARKQLEDLVQVWAVVEFAPHAPRRRERAAACQTVHSAARLACRLRLRLRLVVLVTQCSCLCPRVVPHVAAPGSDVARAASGHRGAD